MRSARSGTLRKDGRWCITLTVTEPNGEKKKVPIYGATQREAQDNAAKHVAKHGRRAPSKRTVDDLYKFWQKDRWPSFAEKTKEYYRWTGKRLLRDLAVVMVDDLRPSDVAKWLRKLSLETSISGRTIQMHRNTLRAMMAYAVELGWCEHNPVREVRLPVSAKPAVKPQITPAMARYIRMKEPNDVLMSLWWLLAECGLRPSEALAAKSSDLLRDRNAWWLNVRGTKTDAAARVVPVPHALAEFLVSRKSWLFPSEVGTPLMLRNVQRAWYAALVRCKLPQTNLYQLRKTCLTRWVAWGLPDDAVKSLAGHTDIKLTHNVYVKPSPARLLGAMAYVGRSGKYVNPIGSSEPSITRKLG